MLKSKALLVAGLFALLTMASCKSYATREELQQLDDNKAKTKSMENKVVELTNEKKRVEQEVQTKKQKLEQAKKEKSEVLKRLEEI
ncbi:MAG TPA: hypothetical protein PKJ64_11255, partial [bacterium]|nr:hypothetical protein [bacterium]